MKKLIIASIFITRIAVASSQPDTNWVRAFPITDYQLALNDSIQIVQLYLPGSLPLKDKQVGVLKGVYQTKQADTTIIGSGKCNLVKGDYYYFTINHKKSGLMPKQGDLLYTRVQRPTVFNDKFLKLASHYISLQDVYEVPLFDRDNIFREWTSEKEIACIDSIKKDIQFTGKYFLQNDPSKNIIIPSGKWADKKVLDVMSHCTSENVIDFLSYVIVRPALYAGRSWKVSEIFATWLSAGAPMVIKN